MLMEDPNVVPDLLYNMVRSVKVMKILILMEAIKQMLEDSFNIYLVDKTKIKRIVSQFNILKILNNPSLKEKMPH